MYILYKINFLGNDVSECDVSHCKLVNIYPNGPSHELNINTQ